MGLFFIGCCKVFSTSNSIPKCKVMLYEFKQRILLCIFEIPANIFELFVKCKHKNENFVIY